jgi:hypothetical protein
MRLSRSAHRRLLNASPIAVMAKVKLGRRRCALSDDWRVGTRKLVAIRRHKHGLKRKIASSALGQRRDWVDGFGNDGIWIPKLP